MFPGGMLDMQIRIAIATLRRLRWPLLVLLYSSLVYLRPIYSTLVLALFMAIGALVYQRDSERERLGLDDYWGSGLFYRYGEETQSVRLVIPVKAEWDARETYSFAGRLRLQVAERLRRHLPEEYVEILDSVLIREKNRSLSKEFLRVSARTNLGSLTVHFLHFASFGRSLTLHYNSFVRGTHSSFDIIKFVFASPLTVWVWIWPWAVNAYSVLCRISHFRKSSYDDMDFLTIHSAIRSVLLNELRDLLEKEEILTAEARQTIYNIITHGNSVNVIDSKGVNLGSVAQTAAAPAPQGA